MTDEKKRSFCGARKKTGEGHCTQPAGWGTDHPGDGKCKLHGGASPIKTGRYSKIKRPRIQDLVEHLESDPDPLNLLPEVLMIRALAIDYIERYDEFSEALLGWHESFNERENPKPRKILDLADASRLLERVARVVDLIQKHQKEGAISIETVHRLMENMGLAVAKHVADTKTIRAIEKDWSELRA